jgi:folylpolyglutamate synthase/dihydropteroate synthase
LRAALQTEFAGKRPIPIFGALADKNWPDICRLLAPLSDKILAVPVASQRTTDAKEVATVFRSANPSAEVFACKKFSEAIFTCKDEPFVVVTGSLYLIGEALEQLGVLPSDGNERGLNEWSAPKS